MTFNHAYQKLTLLYVLIVMCISVLFSLVIYHTSSIEISRGLGRQTRYIQGLPGADPFLLRLQDIEQNRMDQIQESNDHLRTNLILINLIILAASTIVSYFLAKRTLRPIEEMVEAQNRFTADASHELRTPLTAMRSEIEVNLRDQKMTLAEAKELLSSNLEEIAKLEVLSNALLKLAKFQDEVRVNFESVDLVKIIDEAWKKVESLAKEKDIFFKSNFIGLSSRATTRDPSPLDSGLRRNDSEIHKNDSQSISDELAVFGDSQSLVELFVILFDNAIKYSHKNAVVTVSAKEHGHHVEISVADQGIGIKASDLPYIFNRFFRADHSRTKEKTTGYGLGLSIAKQIVDLHNGKIEVVSTPNSGSTFTVSLPTAPKT